MGILVRIVALALLCCTLAGCRPASPMPNSTPRDGQSKVVIWQPDPELAGQLTQTVNLDRHQISLTKDFTSPGSKRLGDNLVQYVWARQSDGKDGVSMLSVVVDSNKKIAEMTTNLESASLGFWYGMVESSVVIENPKREKPESGSINGITFCRFKWSATTKLDGAPIKGWSYGALDGDRLFQFVTMDSGEEAEKGHKLMEAALATFKRK